MPTEFYSPSVEVDVAASEAREFKKRLRSAAGIILRSRKSVLVS